ncbi:hypothetical protein D5R40_13700 [Okeania hirsuta]|uniref:Uncharacterized protein n=1 Tax=Okeania hirsuta TaxID=1458930 RepID=A0A3N6RQ50_9CYAN|nr:hypothetical protein D4Z78_17355 [Okeania hirsuta]RQH43068.1 hypothetical protein D5R40_13700 [Okeania hirsuta]
MFGFEFTEKLWVCASPFKGIKSGRSSELPVGWEGVLRSGFVTLQVSELANHRPREKRIFLMSSLLITELLITETPTTYHLRSLPENWGRRLPLLGGLFVN